MQKNKNQADEKYINVALELARAAMANDEVPIGAIIIDENGQIIGKGANAPISTNDPCAHAEIIALREAALALSNYRLKPNLTLYVTLEPCTMCAGAISFARIGRLVYGAKDEKGGAIESGVKFFGANSCHHIPQVTSGVLAEECGAILKEFFRKRRKTKSKQL